MRRSKAGTARSTKESLNISTSSPKSYFSKNMLKHVLICFCLFQAFSSATILKDLDVKCSEKKMIVRMKFHKTFNGVIFSHGHYDDPECTYVSPKSNRDMYIFTVPIDKCGTRAQLNKLSEDVDKYIENILIIQQDPHIQGLFDLARNVRCIWKYTFAKIVTARPMSFNSIPLVFTKKSINHVTSLHRESIGPFDYPVSGYIYMGEDTSIVVYIQDQNHVFDANVKDCRVTDRLGRSTQLTSRNGCYSNKDLMTPFYKTNSTANSGATMMFYSYFRGYKIPLKDKFVVNCQLEVCAGACDTPCGNPVVRKKRNIKPAQQLEEIFIEEDFFRKPVVVRVASETDEIQRDSCKGLLFCSPIGWIVAMVIMAITTFALILLTAILFYKLHRNNRRLSRKLAETNSPLIAL